MKLYELNGFYYIKDGDFTYVALVPLTEKTEYWIY